MLKNFLKKYSTLNFFVFIFLWSNFIWLYLLPKFNISLSSGTNWFWLGACAPGLGALLFVFLAKGTKGVGQLIKPITYWRTNPFYYYLITIILGCFYLAAIGLTSLQGRSIPTIQSLYASVYSEWFGFNLYGFALIPLFTALYFLCEELGWRGYALPKLLKRYDAFTAAIIIGFFWTLFHVPLMNFSTLLAHPFSIMWFCIHTMMSSFFLTWLYLKTNQSLLLVSLAHALMNFFGAYSPSIISSLGQGQTTSVIVLRFLFFLPIFILLFRDRHALKIKRCS